MGTTLTSNDRINAHFSDLQFKMELCKLAMKIQSLADEAMDCEKTMNDNRDNETREGRDAYLLAYDKQQEAESKGIAIIKRAAKNFEIKTPGNNTYLHSWVQAWNSFCVIYRHEDLYVNYNI